jgi:high-affinity iron transporter
MNQSKIESSYVRIAIILISGSIFISLSVNSEVSATTEEEDSQREPTELISTIRDLLNQTMVEYNKQNYTGAAYIDNFEFLEAPLAEEDEQLMEETEITLREDLSRLIEERAQPQQIQELINEINERLDQAEQLLSN